MSLSPGRLLKSPTPENCQSRPTVPIEVTTGDLIVRDVVDLQPSAIDVAQDHVAFAGAAAEIANSGELPIQADCAQGGRAGDLIVADVVDLERGRIDVAQDHVGVADVIEVSESQNLPF
jgi:hypothetical protein